MLPFSVHKLNASTARDAYRRHLEGLLLDHPFRTESTPEANWSCIVSAAGEEIGRGKRKQPEWFEENQDELMELIEMKNKAHVRMLAVKTVGAKKEFRQQQRKVKKAVDRAKEVWIRKVAQEGEAAKKDGRTRWECIKRLQQSHAGRRPARPSAVKKEDRELAQGPSDVMERWHQHFSNLLNRQSTFNNDVIQRMPMQSPCLDLDEPPTEEELENALSKMKKRKAGGKTGILPELVLFGGATLLDRLLELMQAIWKEGEVVADWKNAKVWQVLERCGVPPMMLKIVKSFHEGMEAEVRVGAMLSDSFQVRNGLRQGCTLAPTLQHIYFSAVVKSWRDDCEEAGVDVLFKHGRKLVGDRTAKSRLSVTRVHESQIADDAACTLHPETL